MPKGNLGRCDSHHKIVDFCRLSFARDKAGGADGCDIFHRIRRE
jgi:hypothetical protein